MQAARLVAKCHETGFDALRARNRELWGELWKSRIILSGAGKRWQAIADAAFFYLNTSVHASSYGSTSMFGLATWKDYHYYYGHVMWDIEAFAIPVLSLLQPHGARALLEYRFRSMLGAHNNAVISGYRGLQFPWECEPSTGEEAAPLPGSAAWHEHHVSVDVALAFIFHARVTGDREFLRTRAWPVVAGVAEWLESRVVATSRGFEIQETMGIAERQRTADNSAFTNIAAKQVLRAAIEIGTETGTAAKPIWSEIAEKLVIPMQGDAIVSYDGHSFNHEKAATPDPLAVLFPLGHPVPPESERATLALFLPKAADYIGSPMLSALYGVWAAWSGDRELASKMLDEGYAAFLHGRFMQTLEYRPDRFPEQPPAGPFMANIGGFLMSLLLGFPALLPDFGEPERWPRRPVVLPAGWQAIEVGRLWVRGKPVRMTARQGDAQPRFEPTED